MFGRERECREKASHQEIAPYHHPGEVKVLLAGSREVTWEVVGGEALRDPLAHCRDGLLAPHRSSTNIKHLLTTPTSCHLR